MEDKSSKTIWTLIVGALLIAGILFVIYNLWKIVLGAVVGLCIGYYFGYSKGKQKRRQ